MTKQELATISQPTLEATHQQTIDTIIQGIKLNQAETKHFLLISDPNNPLSKTDKLKEYKSLTFEAGIGPFVSTSLWKLASDLNRFYLTQQAEQQGRVGESYPCKQWQVKQAKSKVDDLKKPEHLENFATDLQKSRTRDQERRDFVQHFLPEQ